MYIIGVMVIIIFIVVTGYVYLKYQQNKYRMELEQHIDNIYLEGNDKIVSTFLLSGSITLEKVEDYKKYVGLPVLDPLKQSGTQWNGVYVNTSNCLRQLTNESIYKYFSVCGTISWNRCQFLIAVEKNDNGYTIFAEEIIGLGITKEIPQDYITVKKDEYDASRWNELFNDSNLPKTQIRYSYHIANDLIRNYENELLKVNYKDFALRNYTNGRLRNNKYDMLNQLIMKTACAQGESLYFRVNPYYELKLNEYYSKIGSGPIRYTFKKYGNVFQDLIAIGWEANYSIQENEGVLKSEIKILFSYILGCVLILYTVAYVLMIKHKNHIKKARIDM